MRWWIRFFLRAAFFCAAQAFASPVDFGMAELNAAIAARNFKYPPKILAELDIQAPETYRIEPYAAGGGHITGGDLRGLMYGLLEAAEQMRSTGRLKQAHGAPVLALRGLRIAVKAQETAAKPQEAWFNSPEFWNRFFADMARDRFNRLEIAFDSAPSPDAAQPLRSVTQLAQQYGVDIAIGFGAPDVPAIAELLKECPAVRTVALHGSTLPDGPGLLRALHESGRRVVLELADHEAATDLIEAAGQAGAPLRLFAPFNGELFNPRPRDSYWEMDASQGPDAVNAISGAGFEIAAPADLTGRPSLDAIAFWGRSGYARPAQ